VSAVIKSRTLWSFFNIKPENNTTTIIQHAIIIFQINAQTKGNASIK
jgi:hypothetical protein